MILIVFLCFLNVSLAVIGPGLPCPTPCTKPVLCEAISRFSSTVCGANGMVCCAPVVKCNSASVSGAVGQCHTRNCPENYNPEPRTATNGVVKDFNFCKGIAEPVCCVPKDQKPVCPWSEWSKCTASCGGSGMQTRVRQVSSNPEQQAQDSCVVPTGTPETETRTCVCDNSCEQEMEFSKLGSCSATQCDVEGIQVWTKPFTSSPACAEDAQGVPCQCVQKYPDEQRTCKGTDPRDCVTTKWQNVGDCQCTSNTAMGLQFQTREVTTATGCGGNPCGNLNRQIQCPCPVDCAWSWGAWGPCNLECGGGTQDRIVKIDQQPANGGQPCPSDVSQSQRCNTQPCACTYTAWDDWSACTKTCGGGQRTRQRRPISGTDCADTTQTETCNVQGCPKDCEVSEFVTIPQSERVCSKPCGGGTQVYKRRTITAQEQNGGTCQVNLEATEPCNQQPCDPCANNTCDLQKERCERKNNGGFTCEPIVTPPTCPAGSELVQGVCVCKEQNYYLHTIKNECVFCPGEFNQNLCVCRDVDTEYDPITKQCVEKFQCPDDANADVEQVCICTSGDKRYDSAKNECVDRCPSGARWQKFKKTCQCQTGFEYKNNDCVEIEQPCPEGAVRSGDSCRCPADKVLNDEKTACVDAPSCGTNQVLSGGKCVCVDGYKLSANDDCVKDGSTTVTCPTNAQPLDGSCRCIQGYVFNAEAVCVKVDSITCPDPKAQVLADGSCACPAEYELVQEKCVKTKDKTTTTITMTTTTAPPKEPPICPAEAPYDATMRQCVCTNGHTFDAENGTCTKADNELPPAPECPAGQELNEAQECVCREGLVERSDGREGCEKPCAELNGCSGGGECVNNQCKCNRAGFQAHKQWGCAPKATQLDETNVQSLDSSVVVTLQDGGTLNVRATGGAQVSVVNGMFIGAKEDDSEELMDGAVFQFDFQEKRQLLQLSLADFDEGESATLTLGNTKSSKRAVGDKVAIDAAETDLSEATAAGYRTYTLELAAGSAFGIASITSVPSEPLPPVSAVEEPAAGDTSTSNAEDGFPIWIVIVAVVVCLLIVAAIVACVFMKRTQERADDNTPSLFSGQVELEAASTPTSDPAAYVAPATTTEPAATPATTALDTMAIYGAAPPLLNNDRLYDTVPGEVTSGDETMELARGSGVGDSRYQAGNGASDIYGSAPPLDDEN